MAVKISTSVSLDPELKREAASLFSDLGMDLSTAISVFLRQAVRVQGFPFAITRETPNTETLAAMNEYYGMKAHPERYKRYKSFEEGLREVLSDA